MECNWYWWAFKTHVQTNNLKVLFIKKSNKLKLNILKYLILNSRHFFLIFETDKYCWIHIILKNNNNNNNNN